MDSSNGTDALPPPPPVLPPDIEPVRVKTELAEKKNLRTLIPRRGFGSKGQKIPLLTNHFKVNVAQLQGHFHHYSVALYYDDGHHHVEAKGIGRKILDRLHDTYRSDLDGKEIAYDGEKILFTFGALPSNKMDFSVVLEKISSARTNGNATPNGNESPGDVFLTLREQQTGRLQQHV